jgi:hypothetical protein
MDNWKGCVKEIADQMGVICSDMPDGKQIVIAALNPIFMETSQKSDSLFITGKLLPVMHPATEDPEMLGKLLPIAQQITHYIDPNCPYCDISDNGLNLDVFYKIALESGLPDKETFVLVLHIMSKIQVKFTEFLEGRISEEEMDCIIKATTDCIGQDHASNE